MTFPSAPTCRGERVGRAGKPHTLVRGRTLSAIISVVQLSEEQEDLWK